MFTDTSVSLSACPPTHPPDLSSVPVVCLPALPFPKLPFPSFQGCRLPILSAYPVRLSDLFPVISAICITSLSSTALICLSIIYVLSACVSICPSNPFCLWSTCHLSLTCHSSLVAIMSLYPVYPAITHLCICLANSSSDSSILACAVVHRDYPVTMPLILGKGRESKSILCTRVWARTHTHTPVSCDPLTPHNSCLRIHPVHFFSRCLLS